MSWERCQHGYNITPVHKCPWCFPEDSYSPDNYVHIVGKGNGWLLKKDDLVCEGCGGPRGAGWGAWTGPELPTPDNVREALSTMMYCYQCVCEGKLMRRTSKQGEVLTADELKKFHVGRCPDCGKGFHLHTTEHGPNGMFSATVHVELFLNCPRLTCGSRFLMHLDQVVRASDGHPDEPPGKSVAIE